MRARARLVPRQRDGRWSRAGLLVSLAAVLPACTILLSASGQLSGSAAAIQLQLADVLFGHAEYRGAMGVYQRVATTGDPSLTTRARVGTVRCALRIAEFDVAMTQATALHAAAPDDPAILTLWGDSLWASGLFQEAEDAYRDALARDPASPRAHHGFAKALASRNQLQGALDEAEAALRAAPDDPELHHTVGYVSERMRRFDRAAAEYAAYLSLLAPGDRTEKEVWVRNDINFLRSFGNATPFELVAAGDTRRHTVPFRLANEKVVFEARVNGNERMEFTLDTGAEHTVVSSRAARRLGLDVMGQTLSAGVGFVGLRGVEISKIDELEIGSLKVRNVPCLIKNPPLPGLPMGELESLSPLALGLSVRVDYKNRRLTFGELERDDKPAYELPLRMHRLATVRGMVNGQPASFVVDTGGQVISLNTSTARSLFQPADRRRIALRVYGTSGLDPDAYLLPGVSLAFDEIRLPTQPVVVLNLRAPSVLLGYHLGGIVGHKFLSKYCVEFDMDRSVLRLTGM